ncbi:MAG: hypothetical protein ABFD69_00380 [Candidatus Sumerlaeia bacterium]
MNSIHDAIRKFRPDLKLDGWSASARLMPATPAYPETIKPETVMRGLMRSDAAAGPPRLPEFSWRPVLSLALVFALAVTVGAALTLRPARTGVVKASYEPRSVARFEIAKISPPPGFTFAEPAVAAAPAAAKAAAEAAPAPAATRTLAPIRKPSMQYISLQPVKTAAPAEAAPSSLGSAAQASVPPEIATVNDAPAPAVNSGSVPEVLYESESPQTMPATEYVPPAAPAAHQQARTDPPAASNSEPSAAKVRIQGIFWDSARPMALLGDDIVEVGSMTPLGKVVEITKKNVVFERNGARVTLAP